MDPDKLGLARMRVRMQWDFAPRVAAHYMRTLAEEFIID